MLSTDLSGAVTRTGLHWLGCNHELGIALRSLGVARWWAKRSRQHNLPTMQQVSECAMDVGGAALQTALPRELLEYIEEWRTAKWVNPEDIMHDRAPVLLSSVRRTFKIRPMLWSFHGRQTIECGSDCWFNVCRTGDVWFIMTRDGEPLVRLTTLNGEWSIERCCSEPDVPMTMCSVRYVPQNNYDAQLRTPISDGPPISCRRCREGSFTISEGDTLACRLGRCAAPNDLHLWPEGHEVVVEPEHDIMLFLGISLALVLRRN